jgi:hypothetical protein
MESRYEHIVLSEDLDNEGCEASLEVGKLCRLIPDAEAAARGYFRVMDDTGED